jgi:hypothetical protein
MPFIGQQPITGAYSKLDAITTSATATYNLQLNSGAYSPASANHLLVSLNGVMQAPQDSFTVSGSTITFASALTSSDNIDFIMALGDVLNIGTPSDGTVNSASIVTGAVTDAKIASGITASKLTGALPALDGSALTGLGKVLQVVSYRTAVQANTGGPWASTGLEVSITPSNANNKVLVLVSQPMAFTIGTTADRYCEVQLRRGSTQRAIARQDWQGMWGTQGISEANWVQTFILLDDPNTTSATQYDTRIQVSAGTCDIYAQKGNNSDGLITLMEIEA